MRLALAAAFFLLAACGAPRPDCGPSNCSGCCSSEGECLPGNQNVACGNGGGLCDVCGFSSRCELGACFFSQTGGGGGATGGGGGATGGGYVGDGGFQLFFRGSIDGGTQQLIHVAAPAGTPPALVSTPNRRTTGFAVTPSGALLAIAYDGTPTDELVMLPAGGVPLSIRTTAATMTINAPLISPDEQQVAWLEGTSSGVDGGGFDLYVASAVTSSTPRLASPPRGTLTNLLNASLARFSPDSRYLAVRGDFNVNQAFELHVFDLQTGQRTPLVIATGATAGGVTNFGWTSSGQLVVHGALDGNPERLHLCSVSGACSPFVGPALNATIDALAVSPDGTFVVYASNERGGQYDLYRANATGGTPMRLAPDAPSGWRPNPDGLVISPTGQWVALVTTTGNLQVLSTTGNAALVSLYTAVAPIAVFNPTFSPNSSQLAFRSDLAIDGSYDLYRLVDFSTSAQTPVLLQSASGGSITAVQWTQ